MHEYKQLINQAFPNYIIDSAYDYGDIYVFNLLPKEYSSNNFDDGPLNRSFSINKKTKEIKSFFPFDISFEIYKNGKKVI